MSAAAKPQLSLWMVVCVERGFHTARGWTKSADYAHLFTEDQAGAFISEHAGKDPNALLVAVHYDAQAAHGDVRVIEHMTNSGAAHGIDHLNSVARAAIKDLRLDKHEAGVVQVVAERSAADSDGHLDMLAKNAITRMRQKPERVVTRRFDAALARYDRAFEAYRLRLAVSS